MSLLQERRLARYMDVSSGSALGHTFIVGGAAIYRHVLTTTSPAWALENLLVTRIMRPHAENESYDVFLDEFRSEKQQTWEEDTAKACVDVLPTDERLHYFKPNYSPYGRWLLVGCAHRDTPNEDLCIAGADGSDPHPIVETDQWENHGVW